MLTCVGCGRTYKVKRAKPGPKGSLCACCHSKRGLDGLFDDEGYSLYTVFPVAGHGSWAPGYKCGCNPT